MAMFYALMALCLSGSALAQKLSFGSCPRVEGQSNFDITKFMGDWYEQERFFTLFELGSKCNVVFFRPFDNGTVQIVDTFISRITGKVQTVRAALRVDPEIPGKMSGKIPMTPFGEISDCWLLGTDYDSYSVIYCCTEFQLFNLQWMWLLSREKDPQQSVVDKAYEAIDKNNIERKNDGKIEQGCEVKPST